jgi:uncharacterized repeat protein (TIGR03837 family)
MNRKPSTCAVFCRVVDNFGDAGVALRLARQLAHEHALESTFYVDDLASLARIAPGVDAGLREQRHAGVTLRHFGDVADAPAAELVVEAFGCGLPDAYLDAMERRERAPVWINLEYLSAEDWVDGTHGLPSPPPRRALHRWFYFPGFTPRTGGLIRERGLFEARDAHRASIGSHAAVWQAAGLQALPANALTVSLFCYANRAAAHLLRHWIDGDEPVACIVPQGVATDAVTHAIGRAPGVGSIARRGALTLAVAPFVDQAAFDARLWSCAFNFVRGEDSFVRAQWAARPFAWHIYPQAQDAHRTKLAAFVDRYAATMPRRTADALRAFQDAWNAQDGSATAAAWGPLRGELPQLARHARRWCDELARGTDLASGLVAFAAGRL